MITAICMDSQALVVSVTAITTFSPTPARVSYMCTSSPGGNILFHTALIISELVLCTGGWVLDGKPRWCFYIPICTRGLTLYQIPRCLIIGVIYSSRHVDNIAGQGVT